MGADRGLDAPAYVSVDAVERGFGHEGSLGGAERRLRWRLLARRVAPGSEGDRAPGTTARPPRAGQTLDRGVPREPLSVGAGADG